MSAFMPDAAAGESVTSPAQAAPSDRNKHAGGSALQESMAEPELLALIIEMRLKTGRSPGPKEKSDQAADPAATSVDTMDLCHRKIHKLPEEMVDIIKDDIVRLALGYNFITALPTSFVDLSKLRYLNIRANLMSVFPDVLCSLPSLEILDMSRNKVRKLPENPGRLTELRVLSIANNRIRRLPEWLTAARHLRIFKIEGNPINWPPPHVSVMPAFDKASVVDSNATSNIATDDRVGGASNRSQLARKKAEDRHMLVWLAQLKSWIAEHYENVEALRNPKLAGSENDTGISSDLADTQPSVVQQARPEPARSPEPARTSTEDNKMEKEADVEDDVIALAVSEPKTAMQEIDIHPIEVPRAYVSRMADSEKPLSSSPEAIVTLTSAVEDENAQGTRSEGPSASTSLRFMEQSEHDQVLLEDMTNSKKRRVSHQRNDSLDQSTASTASKAAKPALRSKKSLPDLRSGVVFSANASDLVGNDATAIETGEASSSRASPSNLHSQRTTFEATTRRKPAPIITNTVEQKYNNDNIELDLEVANSTGAVESERNSYFKRLSTLPASSISTHVSISVLLCIDATRGILYALSQMHTAFRQYVAFATDERLTSQLSRVLGIAGNSMASLINALDRFDSQSRTKSQTMDPRTIRGVICATMESIHTFRKLVHVVQIQLKSLQTGADIRYTRTLLLLLYGSLAEIANSWGSVEPLLADVAPYMLMGASAGGSSSSAKDYGFSTSSTSFGQSTLPSIAEANSPITPSSRTRMIIPPARPQRRRHAGSFSANDVVQGGTMASTVEQAIKLPEDKTRDEVRSTQKAQDLSTLESSRHVGRDEEGSGKTESFNEKPKRPTVSEAGGRRTLSSSSNQTTSAQRSIARQETLVDDHLMLLVVKITSIAFSVWAGIQDHLVALGLPTANSSTHGAKMSITSAPTSAQEDDGVAGAISSLPKTPSRVARAARQGVSEASGVGQSNGAPETPGQSLQSSRSLGGVDGSIAHSTPQSVVSAGGRSTYPNGQAPSPAFQRQLRQLHDLTRGVDEHTHRLYACLERAQEMAGQSPTPLSPPTSTISSAAAASRHLRSTSTVSSNANSSSGEVVRGERSGQTSATRNAKDSKDLGGEVNVQAVSNAEKGGRDLFAESGHFIKSVLHISHFIKGLAAEGFALPKYVKASLAELTTCARDLTLHLHFLSGPTPAPMLASQAHANAAPATAMPAVPSYRPAAATTMANNDEVQSHVPASAPAH